MNSNDLKVLMISSDRNILLSGSAVSERMKEYGDLVAELHIVILSSIGHKLTGQQISKNTWIYPTNSLIKFLRPLEAAKIGKKIVFDKKFVRGRSIITTQDPFECGWAGLKIKNKWRLPLEVQLHTDPFSSNFKGFLNLIRKFIAKRVIKNADSIRVVTKYLKSKILNLKSNAIINVLPIYVARDRIENAPIAFDLHARFGWHFILLSVSRLEAEKNLSTTLQALSIVRQKYRDVGLVVVGSGREEANLKALVKKIELENAVAFVGWQENLASFYKTANVFIQTSEFEGYGVSLVEAGLSGLPILTTPVGVAKEFEADRDAYIYPSNRPDLFATGIIDLIENNFKRENLKTNMKRFLMSKLLSKEAYLQKIKEGLVETAKIIK